MTYEIADISLLSELDGKMILQKFLLISQSCDKNYFNLAQSAVHQTSVGSPRIVFYQPPHYIRISQSLSDYASLQTTTIRTPIIIQIMATECKQCFCFYDQQKNIPRVCTSCGHSLCQECLNDICSQEHAFKCPYCKSSTKTLWTKNQSLLNLISSNGNNNKCQAHQRKAISLCCSANCTVSPVICDLAECSKLHKQKGLNNLPLSFFSDSSLEQKDGLVQIVVQNLLTQIRQTMDKILAQQKKRFLNKCSRKESFSLFKQQTQHSVNLIKQGKFSGLCSKKLADVKKQMIFMQEEQQTQMMSKLMELVDDSKRLITNSIIQAIDKIEVNLIQSISKEKTPTPNTPSNIICIEQFSNKPTPKNQTPKTPQVQTIDVLTKTPKKSEDQLYEDAIRLCFEPKTHLEYQLIRQVTGRDFSISLLFSAAKDSPSLFKQKIAGQQNLFVRVQLNDGRIFGSFFKKAYPMNFGQDVFVPDPDAFVYWLNEFRVYKAAKGSIAQYDIGPAYLFSCGSTYNWDGFWFRKDFKQINPQMPMSNKQIKSKQYVQLSIPLPDRKVSRFEAYQVQFKQHFR